MVVAVGLTLCDPAVAVAGVQAAALSPDGKALATGENGALRLWDLQTGKETRSFDLPSCAVSQIRFSPDGKRIAVSKYIPGGPYPEPSVQVPTAATLCWASSPGW